MNEEASREAFDLFSKQCRKQFIWQFKYKWNQLWWWKLVIHDTKNRVCSKGK